MNYFVYFLLVILGGVGVYEHHYWVAYVDGFAALMIMRTFR